MKLSTARIKRLRLLLPALSTVQAFAIISAVSISFIATEILITFGILKIAWKLTGSESAFISGAGYILAGSYIGVAAYLTIRLLAPERKT